MNVANGFGVGVVAGVFLSLVIAWSARSAPVNDRDTCAFVRIGTPMYVNPVKAKEAVGACRRLLAAKPSPPEAARLQAALGWALSEANDYKGAWQAAQASTALQPTEPGGYEVRASISRRLKQYDIALNEIDKALPYGLTYDGHYTRSRIMQDLKRYDEAIAEADLAIKAQPTFSPPYVTRGVSQQLKGDIAAAFESYRLAERLDPRSPVIAFNISLILSELDREDEALRYLDRSIELDPRMPDAQHQRAYLRRRAGDLPAALADYQSVLRTKPKDVSALVGLALVQSYMGDDRAAYRLLDRAERADPTSADVWGVRCFIAAIHDDRVADRMPDCDKAVRMDPSADQLSTRALARQRLGDAPGALADAEAAVSVGKASADAYFTRGWIKAQQGRPGAHEDLIAALKIERGTRARYERLGLSY